MLRQNWDACLPGLFVRTSCYGWNNRLQSCVGEQLTTCTDCFAIDSLTILSTEHSAVTWAWTVYVWDKTSHRHIRKSWISLWSWMGHLPLWNWNRKENTAGTLDEKYDFKLCFWIIENIIVLYFNGMAGRAGGGEVLITETVKLLCSQRTLLHSYIQGLYSPYHSKKQKALLTQGPP